MSISTPAAEASLRPFASVSYRRYRLPVVAITGSVGKTTTKDFTAAILAGRFKILRTKGNHNDLGGVLTSILHVPRVITFSHFLRRLVPIVKRTLKPKHADMFVLEVGGGHIAGSLQVFRPTIAVVTAVSPVHMGNRWSSMEEIANEKARLVRGLREGGHAVLCYDNEYVRRMASLHSGRTVFFGFDRNADVWMEEPEFTDGGLATTLHDSEGDVRLVFPSLNNRSHLLCVMAAWAVGLVAGVPRGRMATIAQRLTARAGRGRVLPGVRGTRLMDESFNANPASMKSALEAFRGFAGERRRLVVLGEMLDLGSHAEQYHREIGREAAVSADVLVAVGGNARFYVEEIAAAGAPVITHHVDSVEEAASVLDLALRDGDAVLLKGSNGVRLGQLLRRLVSSPSAAQSVSCVPDSKP